MNPVNKAIWYIERHLQSRMSLDDVARSAGVSGFHLLRAFSAATGTSVMRYVRGRRLTEAARRLATGATDILTVAGLAERYSGDDAGARIPGQWQRFRSLEQCIARGLGDVTYGVCYNADDEGNMDYLCGAQVTDFSDLPIECSRLRIATQQYAVFWHGEHISAARSTWDAIWNGWLPQSRHTAADAPLMERYDQRFDRHTGSGGVEFWVPLNE